MGVESQRVEEFRLTKEPYYLPLGNEVELFEAAYNARLPVMLKGPTGCGKTRFVEHMSWRLGRTLITVACHEDLTASDLVGKYTLQNDATVWQDGPLTTAVKSGGIAYLDEVVEARKDTTVVIHPLTDDRRVLPIEKKGEIVQAPDDFMLVISYNPGYQSVLKDLKHSTKQRFVAIEFDYPQAGSRGDDPAGGVRRRPRDRGQAGQDRREGPQPAHPRARGGRLDAPAGLRRPADRRRGRAARRLREHDLQADHRRRRDAALDRRDHRDAVLDARRAPRRRQDDLRTECRQRRACTSPARCWRRSPRSSAMRTCAWSRASPTSSTSSGSRSPASCRACSPSPTRSWSPGYLEPGHRRRQARLEERRRGRQAAAGPLRGPRQGTRRQLRRDHRARDDRNRRGRRDRPAGDRARPPGARDPGDGTEGQARPGAAHPARRPGPARREAQKARRRARRRAAAAAGPAAPASTGRSTSTRSRRSPAPTPRHRWRPPTPCWTCSTASASRTRAPPSGSAAASTCSSATRKSGAGTSASAPSTASRCSRSCAEGLALKSIARVLKLYATALSGRDIAIRSTDGLQHPGDLHGRPHRPATRHARLRGRAPELRRLQGRDRPGGRAASSSAPTSSASTTSPTPSTPSASSTGADRGDPRRREQHAHRLLRAVPVARARPGPVQPRRELPGRCPASAPPTRASSATWTLSTPPRATTGPELSMLSDPQAVVEALLQTVMGHEPDLSERGGTTPRAHRCRPATRCEPLTARVGDGRRHRALRRRRSSR